MVRDPSRNATSQLRLKARLSMKSYNLNLKRECDPCKMAAVKKRRRLDKEEAECNDERGDEENNEDPEVEEDETDEEDVTETSGVKRKRSGEQHTHCHCPLFKVSEPLKEFMSSGQPYRRYKADQLKKRQRSTECLAYRRRSRIS